MDVNEMLEEIYERLKSNIAKDPAQEEILNETLLRSMVERAYRDVKKARHYPKSYTQAMIERDMLDYESNIEAIAEYDYEKTGGHAMTQYSADGTSIHYIDRNKLFEGVYRISRM